jgi:signal transduction histidine kinase
MDSEGIQKGSGSEVTLNSARFTAKEVERRILRDILVCTILTVLFSSASYFFSLQDALAQWIGRPEIGEVEGFVPVLIYAVWLIGIFTLRRLYDLRSAMSDRAVVEEQLSTTRTVGAVGRMSAGVAHDFNNLMLVIRGSVDLARLDDTCSESVSKTLLPVDTAIDKAVRLSNQLMRLGREKPEPKHDLDINNVISEMMQVLKHLADKEDAVLESLLVPDACRIVASQGHVEQVILNLVANACEAMDNGCTVAIETQSGGDSLRNSLRSSLFRLNSHMPLDMHSCRDYPCIQQRMVTATLCRCQEKHATSSRPSAITL